jgi:hypothetical protein
MCAALSHVCEPYCGQDRDMPDTKPAVAKKTKAPRKRGFNRSLLRGWGLREAHCHRNNVGATTPFPFDNQKQRECGAFPPSLGARPALRFPRSPPADPHYRQARWRKRGAKGLIHMPQAGRLVRSPNAAGDSRAGAIAVVAYPLTDPTVLFTKRFAS